LQTHKKEAPHSLSIVRPALTFIFFAFYIDYNFLLVAGIATILLQAGAQILLQFLTTT